MGEIELEERNNPDVHTSTESDLENNELHRSRHHSSTCTKVFYLKAIVLIISAVIIGTLYLLNKLNIISFWKPANNSTLVTTTYSPHTTDR